MVSLASSLVGGGPDQVLEELRVEPEIRQAVLEREGLLGSLLRAVESLENGRFAELATQLGDLGVSVEELGLAQREAYLWIQSILLAGDRGAAGAAPILCQATRSGAGPQKAAGGPKRRLLADSTTVCRPSARRLSPGQRWSDAWEPIRHLGGWKSSTRSSSARA